MPSRLLILGASVRAAAQSAIRAGFQPVGADMFGDVDLAECCTSHRIDNYPRGLETLVKTLPECPWMYTGALENRADLVDRIARVRELHGNWGDVLRRVRNPFLVRQALTQDGLRCPETARRLPRLHEGLWLRKPFESSGGERISLIRESVAGDDAVEAEPCDGDSRFYFQRFIAGDPCSAIFVGAGGRALLVGATRQIIGAAWTGATGFQYTGSLGPLVLPERIETEFERIGGCLAKRFGLVGIFGVDAILAGNAVLPVEVNPRYTASVEILERLAGIETIAMHVHACRDGTLPRSSKRQGSGFCGKAIIYADRTLTVPGRFMRFARRINRRAIQPAIADIPAGGQQIDARRPVATVFADADSLSLVRQRLECRVRRVQKMLYG
ncbi:MAG: ATP-grasp domain-containing protein [Planctomycetes bacterium]|nr:ATP-grasp domain-containing protein [Planctomycetota bacterium]MBL7040239.1 ATP-grasp domain-containing protein [Pirellulaceae bacterium]